VKSAAQGVFQKSFKKISNDNGGLAGTLLRAFSNLRGRHRPHELNSNFLRSAFPHLHFQLFMAAAQPQNSPDTFHGPIVQAWGVCLILSMACFPFLYARNPFSTLDGLSGICDKPTKIARSRYEIE
jgi:hypothetical protein